MSLFCPPAGFPSHLAILWPLIWAQILVARAWVRATYGKGTLYHWSVTPWGQVFITSIDWIPVGEAPAPSLATLAVKAHARIAALMDGSMAEPLYAQDSQLSAHPSDSWGPERRALHFVAWIPACAGKRGCGEIFRCPKPEPGTYLKNQPPHQAPLRALSVLARRT